MPESHVVFVYGTLKRGFYNHTRFGFDRKTRFLGEGILKGARMYSLGSYPCVVLTDNVQEVVHGELYEYLDIECEKNCRRMEVGAGYVEKQVDVDGIKAHIYVFEDKLENSLLIPDGIWRS